MFYETLHDYLNDQIKRPMQKALEKGDMGEAMEILDFCFQKYEETHAFSKAFEDFALERGVKLDIPIQKFVTKYAAKYLDNIKKEAN